MTDFESFNPNTVLIDIGPDGRGRATRELFRLLSSLQSALQDATSETVLTDAEQTLTNKTIDGDANTLRDIATSSLKSRTGDGSRVVTGTAGAAYNFVAWDENGNAVDSEVAPSDVATPSDLALYTQLDGIARVAVYAVADLPTNLTAAQIIYVSDEAGGAVLAFADGTNWRRVTDRAIVA